MILDEDNFLMHYGILRRSGRYPWGSGQDPEQRSRSFLGSINDLKKQGMSEADIAVALDLRNAKGQLWNTTDWRAAKSIAKNQTKQADISMARRLKYEKGYSNVAIGERMGIPESSVRALLAPSAKDRADVLQATTNMLKDQVAKKEFLMVGAGVEHSLGITDTKLKTAIAMLKEEGYKVHYLQVQQLGTGKMTTVQVLTKPGVEYKEVLKNKDNVQLISGTHSEDGGRTFLGIKPPTSISSKRIDVKYAEQGGKDADGVIYVRPGVHDVSLGAAHYAQVRIAVDGTHFLKGMAMYKDDLPEGVDLQFNTNKSNTGNKLDAMKPMKRDKDGNIDQNNPFGAIIDRQSGVMNVLNEEGTWDTWSRTLSSQFLSKQSPTLIKSQLDLTYSNRKRQLDEIRQLNNPAVRRKLLEDFAEDADSASVHLKAAQLPRQSSQVILPITSMKETEVYAPNYDHGERVVLVRYPHGGTFEIPELTVNNHQPEASKLLGQAKDAIGIHPKVAQRLSGADFDGDFVLVIPNNTGRVKSSRPLEDLKDFDPHKYKLPDDSPIPRMTKIGTQRQMGDISNLITDMTIKGASNAELARAVKHSMVVIDAEKHGLNYKQSAIDNGIGQLKTKYQGGPRHGASTLISRKGSDKIVVPERKQNFRIDPETGRKIYLETGRSFVGRNGEIVRPTSRLLRLRETQNAHTMSSGTPVEKAYADHSNKLKDLANQARKELVNTKSIPYSPSAQKAYAPQVERLKSAIRLAERNAPLERKAQLAANAVVRQQREAYPDMSHADLKKVSAQALAEARTRVGAKKMRIEISDEEWKAIQAGAISNNMLEKVLRHADMERVKQLATPRKDSVMTTAVKARADQMLASGYTQADVARQLGVSLSTLKSYINKASEVRHDTAQSGADTTTS